MTINKLMSKRLFIVLVFLIAGISSTKIEHKKAWDDPWCKQYRFDGLCCLVCSDGCSLDQYGVCHPVSKTPVKKEPVTKVIVKKVTVKKAPPKPKVITPVHPVPKPTHVE